MIITISYQELQQIIADRLHQNIELQGQGDEVLNIFVHMEVKQLLTINSRVETKLEMHGDDLYMDYKVTPLENLKKGYLSMFLDKATPNAVNLALSFLQSRYPQYSHIVEKVPNANRLRIHLAEIPQLHTVLEHMTIESIVPKEEGLQLIAQLKS